MSSRYIPFDAKKIIAFDVKKMYSIWGKDDV